MKWWLRLMKIGRKLGCHQIPERSFFFRGYQFPVCARCTGIFLGGFIGIIFFFIFSINWWICLLLLTPMVIDGGLQYIRVWKSNNILRVLTGFIAGFGLGYLCASFAKWLIVAIINLF